MHPPWAVEFVCLFVCLFVCTRGIRRSLSVEKIHSRDSRDFLVGKKLDRRSHSIPRVLLDSSNRKHPSGFHTLRSLPTLNDVVLLSNI